MIDSYKDELIAHQRHLIALYQTEASGPHVAFYRGSLDGLATCDVLSSSSEIDKVYQDAKREMSLLGAEEHPDVEKVMYLQGVMTQLQFISSRLKVLEGIIHHDSS